MQETGTQPAWPVALQVDSLGRSSRPSHLHEPSSKIELGFVLIMPPTPQCDVVAFVRAAAGVGHDVVKLDLPL